MTRRHDTSAASTANALAPRRVWRPMTPADIPAVVEVEKTSHAHPWSAGHFADSVAAGHWCQLLALRPAPGGDPPAWLHSPTTPQGDWLVGYVVAMPGVEEAHLLNLTVAPAHRRAGWGRWLLQALIDWAAAQRAATLWLEVRASNHAARQLYTGAGWHEVGVRRGYYPDSAIRREDAIVMQRAVPAPEHRAGPERSGAATDAATNRR